MKNKSQKGKVSTSPRLRGASKREKYKSKRKNKINILRSLFQFFLIVPVILLFFVLTSEFTVIPAHAGINKQINFQGKLVDSSSVNVADGSGYQMVFKLYNVSSNGSAIWTETQNNVSVTAGIFHVALGSVTSLAGIDFNNDQLYLGIQITKDAGGNATTDNEMSPRIQLGAVPYAFNADKLDGVVATQSAQGFSLTGGYQIPETLNLTDSLTLGTTIQPTSTNSLAVKSNGANGLTLDTGAAAAITIGATANGITLGNTTFSNNTGITLNTGGSGNITLGSNNGTGTVFIEPNGGGQAGLILEDQGNGDLFTASAGATTRFVIQNNGNVGIGTKSPLASLDLRAFQYTLPVASLSGSTGKATLILDQTGNGDIFTASQAGGMRFVIGNNGNITDSTYTVNNGILYADNTGLFKQVTGGSVGQCLTGGGGSSLAWATCATGNTGTNFWQIANTTAIAPYNATLDLFIGGTATSSAKFQVLGVGTASIPAGTASTSGYLTFAGGTAQQINLLNNSTLGIYSSVGGDAGLLGAASPDFFIQNRGLMGNGLVGINTSNPLSTLDIRANTYTTPVASISGSTGKATLIVDQSAGINGGDIFTASSSGLTRFLITQNGNVGIGTKTPDTDISGAIGSGKSGIVISPTNNQTAILALTSTGGAGSRIHFGTNGNFNASINWNQTVLNGMEFRPGTTDALTLSDVGTVAAASVSGTTSFASFVVDQTGLGDIFTASQAGGMRFVIGNDGTLKDSKYNIAGGVLYTDNTGTFKQVAAGGVSSQCLLGGNGSTPAWGSCSGVASTNYWQLGGTNNTVLSPYNSTLDFIIGGTSTTSAKFQVFGFGNSVPAGTASTSGYLSFAGGVADQVNLLNNTSLSFLPSVGGDAGATGNPSLFINNKGDGVSNGLVGIGTNSPLSSTGLDIEQNSLGNAALVVANTGGQGDIFTASSGATPKFVIDQNGNVGVGTRLPANTVDITANANALLGITSSATGISNAATFTETNHNGETFTISLGGSGNTINWSGDSLAHTARIQSGGSNGLILDTSAAAPLIFGTNNTDVGRFDSSGNLVINAKSALATLDVRANNSTTPVASFSGATGLATLIVSQSGVGDIFSASNGGATRFVIQNNGNVGIGTNTPGLTLDVAGNARIGTTTAAGDDIVKATTADFTKAGSTASSVSTGNNELMLNVNNSTTAVAPASGQALIAVASTGSAVLARPDGRFLILSGNNLKGSQIYDPVTDTMGGGAITANAVGTPNTGIGSVVFQRADGKFVVIDGSTTNVEVYDPGGNMNGAGSFTANAGTGLLTSNLGAGALAFPLSDGRWFVVLAGAAKLTDIYDPVSNTFRTAAGTQNNTGEGAVVFQRPDGKWVLIDGNQSGSTEIYDPLTNVFTNGVALASSKKAGGGAHAFQLPDGRFLIILGMNTTDTQVYDPVANTFTVGPALPAKAGIGAHSFQEPNGNFLTILAGGNSRAIAEYTPAAGGIGSYADSGKKLQGNAAGGGAVSFQRPDGKYIIVVGTGGAGASPVATTTTTVLDAGWNTNGTWESEDINNTKISTYSAMLWNSYPQNTSQSATGSASVTFMVKTGFNPASLAAATYQVVKDSGDLINATGSAVTYIKVKIQFQMPPPSYYSGNKGNVTQLNVWQGSDGTAYYRVPSPPAVYDFRIQNPIAAYGGNLDPDPTQGRNFATSSAILDGVVTDNSNRLQLMLDKNTPTATGSGGLFIASVSADLLTSAGGGDHAIQRNDGKFVVITGSTTQTNIYDPGRTTFTSGPALPNNAGAGAHSFQMPDGRYLTILGGGTNNTAIYDPIANIFYAGPTLPLGASVSNGAHSFQRPDGKFIVVYGNATTYTAIFDPVLVSFSPGPYLTAAAGFGAHTIRRSDGRDLTILGNTTKVTNVYDPTTNSFSPGPNTAGNVGVGGFSLQRPDGKFLIFHASGANTTSIYDPTATSSADLGGAMGSGPATTTTIGAGAFAIQRPDGKFVIVVGNNNNTTPTTIYDPVTNRTSAGPTLPLGVNTGGFAFQRSDGKFVVIVGNGVNTTGTLLLDVGWNLTGSYVTEQIFAPTLSSNTALYWKNFGGGAINVGYKTASSQLALGQASWISAEKDGLLLSPNSGDQWVQLRFEFQAQLPDFPGGKARVWVGSDNGGLVVYYRTSTSPILQYWKLANTGDPNILTLTTGGLNAFRFTQDGQAFTSANGAWNAGGADLAERYTSTQSLEDGEVVTGDPNNPQGVTGSIGQYQKNILGVVSTDPGFVAGAFTANSYPIALVGRVPVKVSTENGGIKAGDTLTSGSIPGYAMKATLAGRVLGKALEGLTPDKLSNCPASASWVLPTTQCGTIMMFVNLTDYLGEPVTVAMQDTQNLGVDLNATTDATSSGMFTSLGQDMADEGKILSFLEDLKARKGGQVTSEVFTDRVSATNEVISPLIITDTLYAKHIKADQIDGLEILTNRLANLDNNVASIAANIGTEGLDSSPSAQNDITNIMSVNSLAVGGLARLQDLLATQATVSANLRVQGNGLIEGILNVIDTITTKNLFVTQTAEFLKNAIFHGDVTFTGRPTFNGDTAGFALIKKGDDRVTVTFVNEYNSVPIVNASISLNPLTPTPDETDTERQKRQQDIEHGILTSDIRYLVTQKTTKGFTILLSKPAEEDITFSWAAFSVDNPHVFESGITPTSAPVPSDISPIPLTPTGVESKVL